jgi:predicted DNA-binding transcriptional regulator YafY
MDSLASKWHKRVKVVNASYCLQPPKLDNEVFECIQDAALKNMVVRFDYKKHSHDEPSKIIATGLGLFYRGAVAYFIAVNHDSKRISTYPISRIVSAGQSIAINPESPDDFDFEHFANTNYLAYCYGRPFRLSAKIFLSVQREIEDAHLGDKQVVTPIEGDSKFKLLEVDVPYTLNLIQWLLARAAYLKVLGPPDFKAKFDEELRRAFANVESEMPQVPDDRNFQ